MIMSLHAALRAEERANLSIDSAMKIAQRALISGKRASDYPSRERKYLESKDSSDSFSVTYGGNVFIFSNSGRCITMYPLPSWFGSKGRYDGKERVKNPKKYFSRYKTEQMFPC